MSFLVTAKIYPVLAESRTSTQEYLPAASHKSYPCSSSTAKTLPLKHNTPQSIQKGSVWKLNWEGRKADIMAWGCDFLDKKLWSSEDKWSRTLKETTFHAWCNKTKQGAVQVCKKRWHCQNNITQKKINSRYINRNQLPRQIKMWCIKSYLGILIE